MSIHLVKQDFRPQARKAAEVQRFRIAELTDSKIVVRDGDLRLRLAWEPSRMHPDPDQAACFTSAIEVTGCVWTSEGWNHYTSKRSKLATPRPAEEGDETKHDKPYWWEGIEEGWLRHWDENDVDGVMREVLQIGRSLFG